MHFPPIFRRRAANDLVPDAVDWANVGPGNSPQSAASQAMQGFTGTLTLRATLSAGTYGAGIKTFQLWKNGVSAGSLSGASVVDGATLNISISPGDTVYPYATKGSTPGTSWDATVTMSIVETSSNIDTYTVNVTAP